MNGPFMIFGGVNYDGTKKLSRVVDFVDIHFYRGEANRGTPIIGAPTHFIPLSALGEPK